MSKEQFYVSVTNPIHEKVTTEIVTASHIRSAINFISPRTCPYTKHAQLDVALQICNRTSGDMFPKNVRVFTYKLESYNGLSLHTIGFPNYNTNEHYPTSYRTFATYQQAIHFLEDQVLGFFEQLKEGEESESCKEPDDLPY